VNRRFDSRLTLDAWRALAVSFALLALLLAVIVVVQARRPGAQQAAEEVEPPAPQLFVTAATFDQLPGWQEDDLEGFRVAFGRSCEVLSSLPQDRPLDALGLAGSVEQWLATCDGLPTAGEGASLRAFLERQLQPWGVRDHDEENGLFTGYYEPTLRGSRTRTEVFHWPLYRRPPELVTVDLGSFRDDLRGRRVAGEVVDGRLDPYADRSQLEGGALDRRGLELVWVDDPVGAFFLHIQGSGRIELADGGFMRVGYAAQNGHPYFAIGRELVDRGELTMEEVSMQSIRGWLELHPEAAREVMQSNPSFVFFRELGGEAPVGSQGVALTPRRSLAVDRSFLPLGVPLWLDSSSPASDDGEADRPLRRLMIAQDTGGAIRGPVRGDVFWGHGEEAAEIAGRMKHDGRLWVLLPVGVQPAAGLQAGAGGAPQRP